MRYIFCPSAVHGMFGLLNGKRAAIVRRYPAFFCAFFSCLQCSCVCVPPAVRPALLRHTDTGSLTCAQIWVLAVHTKSAQELTRRDRKKHRSSPCRARGSNPGSLDLNSDSELRPTSTTELRPHGDTSPLPPPRREAGGF